MSEIISSFYLPILGRKLLLPNVSVAEVVEYQSPEEEVKSDTDCILGKVKWRGLMLPLLSFEAANGDSYEKADTSRIAVINSISDNQKLPFFAIVTQGIPRLVKVTEDSIDAMDVSLGQAESARVRVDGEEASIPNLDYLESLAIPHV